MFRVLQRIRRIRAGAAASFVVAFLLTAFTTAASASTLNPIPNPPPAPGSYGLEATKLQPPPTTSATIATPVNGASFTTSPITVSGLCTTGLLVQVYDNGVLVGAINCTSGSFSLQVSLFTGQNDLTTTQFDDLGQPGPQGNTVTVNYNNASFTAFGTLVTLTSNYGRRAANPGQTLTWPLLLSGGTGPYAFSINWGDGTKPDLKSQALAGEVDISHIYSQAGIYHVTVTVTDTNGVSAFLQLVAIANGTPANTNGSATNAKGGTILVTKVVWWPSVVGIVLLLPAFWLGRRSQLVSLHRKLERDAANYKDL
ncbi:MAG TPA: PKD domain-containing protein [Candidatus Saccharimonadia bacterium]|nr:PKD domain-containing protein [Candidatus Saccharimonadia bacterium]